MRVHYKRVGKILAGVLVLNWLVALVKIVFGMLSRSSSVTADGLHSLSDGASNIIGLIGISIAAQPKDKDHPYGHKKYETLFSLIIGTMLLFICFNLLKEGICRFYKPVTPVIDLRIFIVMITTLIVNIFVMNYEVRKGKKMKSDILISDSMHTKSDILISTSVIISLIFIRAGFYILDPIVTIMIAFFIAHTAFQIIRENSKVLCDRVVIDDVKKIEDIVVCVKGVLACHKIRTRGRGDDINIDLHVQVKADTRIDAAHRISYEIEDTLKKSIPGVVDVVVHMEPKGEPRDPEV